MRNNRRTVIWISNELPLMRVSESSKSASKCFSRIKWLKPVFNRSTAEPAKIVTGPPSSAYRIAGWGGEAGSRGRLSEAIKPGQKAGDNPSQPVKLFLIPAGWSIFRVNSKSRVSRRVEKILFENKLLNILKVWLKSEKNKYLESSFGRTGCQSPGAETKSREEKAFSTTKQIKK